MRIACIAAVLLVLVPAARAQAPDSAAERALATRAELQALSGHSAAARERLTRGDFRAGDRVVLAVEGEPALSDTFTVLASSEILLPPPVGNAVSLRGVLRSELDAHMRQELARYLQRAAVRAQPLIRLSVQGEVGRAGIYHVAPDGVVADAVMAAGGTTASADIRNVRVERAGESVWEGNLQQLDGTGRTIEEARLCDGDQLVIPRRREGSFERDIRFFAVIVTLVGGIYGLTRIAQ